MCFRRPPNFRVILDLSINKMSFVFLCGGHGRRFQDACPHRKPSMPIYSRPMYEWVIDSVLGGGAEGALHLALPDDSLGRRILHNARKRYGGCFTRVGHTDIAYNTRGPAETCMLCTKSLAGAFWVLDNDILYDRSIAWESNRDPGSVYVVVQEELVKGGVSPYSHVSIEDGLISDIAEKKNVGKHVVLGAYGFGSPGLYERLFSAFLEGELSGGEWFMSSIVKTAIGLGVPVVPVYSRKSVSIGIPEQLEEAIDRGLFTPRPLRWVFDLDGTLVGPPVVEGDYGTVEPIAKTVRFVRNLHERGHYIVIHTARSEAGGELAREALRGFRIPYHELVFGKPCGDVYVDDLSTNPLHWQEGWTVGSIGFGWDRHIIDTYSGNDKIVNINSELCYKIARADEAMGNLFFFKNCPATLREHVPAVYGIKDLPDGKKRMLIEWKDDAIALGRLMNCGMLGRGMFSEVLGLLEKIHGAAEGAPDRTDVMQNYWPKLQRRLSEKRDVYACFDINVAEVERFFDQHEPRLCGCIHGDYWLSNLLWSHSERKLYFIDMRGRLGDKPSIGGDRFYDYAKLLQSLVGFERLVQEGRWEEPAVCGEYAAMMAERFGLSCEEMGSVRKITAFLVLGSVPFHEKIVQNPGEAARLVASLWPGIFVP